MLEMLRVEPWFPLTLLFTSSGHSALRNGAPPPPPHVAVLVAPLEVTCIRLTLPGSHLLFILKHDQLLCQLSKHLHSPALLHLAGSCDLLLSSWPAAVRHAIADAEPD